MRSPTMLELHTTPTAQELDRRRDIVKPVRDAGKACGLKHTADPEKHPDKQDAWKQYARGAGIPDGKSEGAGMWDCILKAHFAGGFDEAMKETEE